MERIKLSFGLTLQQEDYTAFSVVNQPDVACILPNKIGLSKQSKFSHPFFLKLYLNPNPFFLDQNFGILKLQIAPIQVKEEWKEQVRTLWQIRQIVDPYFNELWLGVSIRDENGDLQMAGDIIRLNQHQLNTFQWIQKISYNQAHFLHQSLKSQTLPIHAFGAYSIDGNTQSVGTKIKFSAPELVNYLLVQNDEDLLFTRDDLTFYCKNLSKLPIVQTPSSHITDQILQDVFVDWLLADYFIVQPPTFNSREVTFKIQRPEMDEKVIWDFTTSRVVKRYYLFQFNLIEELQTSINQNPIENFFQEIFLEQLPTGFRRLLVQHQLQQIPYGIKVIGVRLFAPANLPHRANPIKETILFEADDFFKPISIQFGLDEPFELEVTPFCILQNLENSKEIKGRKSLIRDTVIKINESDFSIELKSLKCSSNLCKEAHVTCNISNAEEELIYQNIPLNEVPIQIAFPREENKHYQLEVVATAINIGKVQRTQIPFDQEKVTQLDFEAYGSHEIIFETQTALDFTVIKAVAESFKEDQRAISIIRLSPNQPSVTWTYFSPGIFKSGFYYAVNEGEWSMLQPYSRSKINVSMT